MNEELLDINDDALFSVSPEEDEKTNIMLSQYFNQQENDFVEFRQREQAEIDNGIKLEDYSWTEKTTFGDAGQLSGKNIMDVADSKDTSPNAILDLKDIGEGLMAGCYEALRATQELGAWAGGKFAEMQVGKEIDFDPTKDTEGFGFNQGRYPDQKTTVGNLARSGMQAGIGFAETALLGGAKATKGLLSLAKNGFGRKVIQSVMSAATGMMTDTMAFSANEDNLADVLKQLGLPTIETIAKSEDDSFWTKKIKNGVDGILAGILIDFISKSAKMFIKHVPPKAVQAAGHGALLSYGVKQMFFDGEE